MTDERIATDLMHRMAEQAVGVGLADVETARAAANSGSLQRPDRTSGLDREFLRLDDPEFTTRHRVVHALSVRFRNCRPRCEDGSVESKELNV